MHNAHTTHKRYTSLPDVLLTVINPEQRDAGGRQHTLNAAFKMLAFFKYTM